MINIFKRWFSHSKGQDLDVSQNPWAGLASYEDPETAERKLKFCGRDDDSYDLARLIMGNVFVTLYGKSGIGKTSLLNAGVFPELREEQYTPVSIRLGMRDEEHPQSYQAMIIEAVDRVVARTETINVIDEQQDQQSTDYLWNYFARHRFYDKFDEPTIPAIVFDQFEEVFRGHRDEAETLLRQLDYLNDKDHSLDSCELDGRLYRYEQNFRFVVSIREDDLYRLEDSIDNCYLPALKRCRYRLRSLTCEGARDAILIPGEGLFKADEEGTITEAILSKSRNDDGSISTNIISLLCSRIYADFKKSGADYISPSLVDNFIKGNPFERFYNEATRGFSNKEKSYIEDNLVDSIGRRNSIPESNFLLHVPKGQHLLEGNTRILQRTSTFNDGGNYRIELIHDSFCEPLSKQKEIRKKWKRRWQLVGISSVALLSFCIIAFVFLQMSQVQEAKDRVTEANWKIMENQSRAVAEKASMLVDEGDFYTARLLALEALPTDLRNPNRPYTVEAEAALRKASMYDSLIIGSHNAPVVDAIYSPNGKYIVSGSSDGVIKIWDVNKKDCIKELKGHSSCICTLCYSFDGKLIVSASVDQTIKIWDTETGKCLRTLQGHESSVYCASFSPNAQKVVSCSSDGTIKIWNVNTGMCLNTLIDHDSSVNTAFFDSKGQRIITSSSKMIKIWDIISGDCIKTFNKESGYFIDYALFCPDDNKIAYIVRGATAGYYHIIIQEIESGDILFRLKGHVDFIRSLSFSHNGNYIVSASRDKTVKIWDAKSGQCIRTIPQSCIAHYAHFSPDDSRLVVSLMDSTICLWCIDQVCSFRSIGVQNGSVFFAKYSPAGEYIVSSTLDGKNVINIWDSNKGILLRSLKGHSDMPLSSTFSKDGKFIVSCSRDSSIKIWDVNNGKCIKTLEGHTKWVYDAVFSPDEQLVASASYDKTIRIWNVRTGECLHVLEDHKGFVYDVDFSPDGKYLCSASQDHTIKIWDVNTWKCITTLNGHSAWVGDADFSPDGKYVVSSSGDYTIRIWSVEDGVCSKIIVGHKLGVKSVDYSPDGNYLISSSVDETIRLWDVKTRKCIQILIDGTGEFATVHFSPNGRHIVAASLNNSRNVGSINIWEYVPLQELIKKTHRQLMNRELTPEERHKYYLE